MQREGKNAIIYAYDGKGGTLLSQLTQKAIVETTIRLVEQKTVKKITVRDIVEACGITRNTFYYYFHDIYEVLEYALSKVGVITEEDKKGAVIIGDTVYDVVGANEIGIDSITITYGFGKREELLANGATYIADSVSDIYGILNS